MPDLEALRGETTAGNGGPPSDGLHTARLERIAIVTTKNGDERLVTEWSDENNTQWTSWNRFDGNGLPFTQDLLDGLGVDRSKLTDENLTDELEKTRGNTYQVRTDSQKGRQGDMWFTSTYIEQVIREGTVEPGITNEQARELAALRRQQGRPYDGQGMRASEAAAAIEEAQRSLPDMPADLEGLPERDAAAVGADLFGDDAPFHHEEAVWDDRYRSTR